VTKMGASAFDYFGMRITIGSNVNIDNGSLETFDFGVFYKSNFMRAGTYIFTNGKWSIR